MKENKIVVVVADAVVLAFYGYTVVSADNDCFGLFACKYSEIFCVF